MNNLKWQSPLVLWTLIILVLTWYPKVEVPDIGIDAEDKIAHIAVFALWGVLLLRAVSKYEINRLSFAVKLTMISGTLFAVIDESVQKMVPGRFFSVYDALANVIGVWLSAVFFTYVVLPLRNRLKRR